MLTGVRPAVPAPMSPGRDRRVGHQPANTFCNPATMAGRGLDRKQNANGAGDLEGERRGAYAPPKRFQDEAERRTEHEYHQDRSDRPRYPVAYLQRVEEVSGHSRDSTGAEVQHASGPVGDDHTHAGQCVHRAGGETDHHENQNLRHRGSSALVRSGLVIASAHFHDRKGRSLSTTHEIHLALALYRSLTTVRLQVNAGLQNCYGKLRWINGTWSGKT